MSIRDYLQMTANCKRTANARIAEESFIINNSIGQRQLIIGSHDGMDRFPVLNAFK
jgi:hypothetical protein